jgi:general secretion pathway protein H
MADDGAQGRRQGGFTLVELLVVVALIAIAYTMVPVISAGLPGARLRAAADEVVDRLRDLHGLAVRRGETVELVLDRNARVFHVSTGGAELTLPIATGQAELKPTLASPAADHRARIRFFADGTASGGTLLLHDDGRQAMITIDDLTGRVRRHE